ncbi:MAG: aquaporin family protein [Bacteroidetes bacterium]|nr:MAG: aquaporin family protein [Bacteroidota bacterium]
MTSFAAELLGTFLLLLLGNGVVANVLLTRTKGNGGGLIAITTAWALAVFVGVTVAGPVSGAHLNPAVSLGLALAGKFAWAEVPSYVLAQLIGAALGSGCMWLMYRSHFEITDDRDAKLAVFATGPSIRGALSNLFSEAVGTFVLLIAVFYIAGPELTAEGITVTKVGLGTVGALPIALVVWVIGLSLGGTTGYAINPARDLMPRLMHTLLPIKDKRDSDWSYAWIPVVGPCVGAALAAGLFMALS